MAHTFHVRPSQLSACMEYGLDKGTITPHRRMAAAERLEHLTLLQVLVTSG